ncbi:hypothetical protein [Streptomyces goshikiensis]|uniref:hypothetical protein n=1 Tax=Streptomyces goshikiensis TaxID=1942 RepID=UPI003677A1D2
MNPEGLKRRRQDEMKREREQDEMRSDAANAATRPWGVLSENIAAHGNPAAHPRFAPRLPPGGLRVGVEDARVTVLAESPSHHDQCLNCKTENSSPTSKWCRPTR